jgi:hypothetical protein
MSILLLADPLNAKFDPEWIHGGFGHDLDLSSGV